VSLGFAGEALPPGQALTGQAWPGARSAFPRRRAVPGHFTFNAVLGHSDQNLISWLDFGQGLTPFLNEGTMMTNIHLRP
jgi:hypothetical protein